MKYLLTVLTNGRSEYVERTLEAFFEHVSPAPSAIYAYDDGASTEVGPLPNDVPFIYDGNPERVGMCAANARCWQAAAESDLDWVFHLEDDMQILCPIDLDEIAAVMESHPYLASMTLKRTPWGTEVEHGGFVEQEPGWYERKVVHGYQGAKTQRWFETTRNWSCAPTLFRTDLARALPWSPEPGCETEFGKRLLDEDVVRFGIWGGGECQVAHIGVSRAPGAKGY